MNSAEDCLKSSIPEFHFLSYYAVYTYIVCAEGAVFIQGYAIIWQCSHNDRFVGPAADQIFMF